jgi:hypothetical protein
MLLVSTTAMPHGNSAMGIAATCAFFLLQQRPVGITLVQIRPHNFDDKAPSC